MNILLVLIPVSVLLVALGIWAFFWAVDNGQFDDLDSPALDMLRDDPSATATDTATDTAQISPAAEPPP